MASRLFVACGNSSSVWVFDTFSGEALEQISMSLLPDAPHTSTPNSLALSPDGQTLLVSDADTNAVAVVDVSNGGRSFVNGFVPTGWYPTGAVFGNDGKQIFILSAKGSRRRPPSRPTTTANPWCGCRARCRCCRRRIASRWPTTRAGSSP